MAHARVWRFQMLGSPQLMAPDGDIRRCDRKPLAVLSYLALEGPTSRSRLAGLLWPHTLEGTARNNLVQLLRRMRQAYGEDLVLPADTLELSPGVHVDVWPWIDRSSPPAGDAPAPSGTLLEGVSFDDMPGLDDWLLAQREHLDGARIAWLARAAQRFEDAEQWTEAIDTAQALVNLDPLSEEHYRRLMRLQYLNNDRPAALRTYQRCQQVLSRELGVEPMPVTALLAQEIQQGGVELTPSPRPAQLPLSVRRPPRLVGRSEAWQAMEDAWTQGQFIVLTGAPGVGKSRLMHDFVATKGRVLRIEARPGDARVPFSTTARNVQAILSAHPDIKLKPWQRRALAPLLPDLMEEGDADVSGDVPLHTAIQDVFKAGARDVAAIVYEDLQYADLAAIEAGLVLISSAFPLGRPGGVPHMLATVRSDELTAETTEIFQNLVRNGLSVQIELPPLATTEVQALVEQLGVPISGDLKRRLTTFAGGNPLFLLETVRSLIEHGGHALEMPERLPVTDKVSRIIDQRLARLSSGALNTARAASILQSDFNIELISEVLGAPLFDVAAHWEELEGAQIVLGECFQHDLIYEAIRDGIPDPIRKLLHRSAARALARVGASRARIAVQWQHSGSLQEAAPCFLEAAREAQTLARENEARAFFALSADLYDGLGDPDRAAQIRRDHLETTG